MRGSDTPATSPQPISKSTEQDSLPKNLSWRITKDLLLGRVALFANPIFQELSSEFSTKSIYMLRPAAQQFEAMCRVAQQEGIYIQALSGARSLSHQQAIWERKWKSRSGSEVAKLRSILRFSAMPMTSRHHWGTDVDINSLDNDYFLRGEGLRLYRWMQANAPRFGYWQVYTDKASGRKGYEMERWHWSYMPIAEPYLRAYLRLVSYDDLRGFSGAELARSMNIIEDYVCGIDRPTQAKY